MGASDRRQKGRSLYPPSPLCAGRRDGRDSLRPPRANQSSPAPRPGSPTGAQFKARGSGPPSDPAGQTPERPEDSFQLWERGCPLSGSLAAGLGRVRSGVEAPADSSGNGRRELSSPDGFPGYPKRAYWQRGETNFPSNGQGPQRDRWRVPACISSTLPSPPLPFEPFLVLHTPPGRTVNGELVRGRLGVARSFSPPRPRASRLFHG